MATYTDQLLVYLDGKVQKTSNADTIVVGGDFSIGGNLTVSGDIVAQDSTNVLLSDNFVDLSQGYLNTSVARAAGFTANVKAATGFTALTATTFTEGVTPSTPPTFTVTSGGSTLAAGDIVQISGASNPGNNGLFIVESEASNVVTVYGIGGTAVPAYALFCQNQFSAATGDSATVTKVDLAVLAISDGVNIKTSSGTPITVGRVTRAYYPAATVSDFNGTTSGTGYVELTDFTGAITLQSAYDGGDTIVLDDTRPLTVSKPVSGSAGISLEANDTISITGDSANIELTTSTTGDIVLTAAQGMLLYSADASEWEVDGFDLTLSTINSGNINISAEDDINIAAGTTSSLSLSAQNLSIGVDASQITLATSSTAGTIFAGNKDVPLILGEGSDTTQGAAGVALPVAGGSGIVRGNLLYVQAIATGRVALADADGTGTRELVGVALQNGPIIDGALKVCTVSGTVAWVKFASAPSGASDNGRPVYLSTTAGEATMTPPGSGRVYRVGILLSHTADTGGLYKVLYLPQFIADL